VCSTACCRVLQCVAVCCSVLQCVAMCCTACCRVLQSVAVCCLLRGVTVCWSVLQCFTVCCSVLQYLGVEVLDRNILLSHDWPALMNFSQSQLYSAFPTLLWVLYGLLRFFDKQAYQVNHNWPALVDICQKLACYCIYYIKWLLIWLLRIFACGSDWSLCTWLCTKMSHKLYTCVTNSTYKSRAM